VSMPPTDTKTVLVVDDDPSLRLVLTEVLAQEGYAAVQAPNGQVGLRLAERLAPDVILLDLAPPGKSGLDVLEELKGRQATRAIPVIVMSAYAHLLRKSDMRYAAGVLQKPFDLRDLLGQVQRAAWKSSFRRSSN
jgi:two-component system, response regulator, stage 0 sporulation protein F